MKKKKKNDWFRKLMNDLHLWMGIGSGLILFVVCFTGAIYIFRPDIEKILEPEKYYVNQTSDKKHGIEELKDYVETETSGKVQRLYISDNSDENYVFTVSVTDGENKSNIPYYINPYTKEIQGSGSNKSSSFFTVIMKLHRWLLLDREIGRPIVGISTIIFIIISLTGLFLWFPKKIRGWKSFKPGFKIKYKSNWKRINHDLHNTLGFYSLLIALILALTGLCWSFEWYRIGLGKVLGVKVFAAKSEIPPESNWENATNTITLAEAISITEASLPYKGNTSVNFPKNKKAAFLVQKNSTTRFNESAYDRLFIDQYSGEILTKDLYDDKSFGGKIAALIKAIHLGYIFGMFSKIICLIVCLIAASLPITGIIIWLNKLKKKPKKKAIEQV